MKLRVTIALCAIAIVVVGTLVGPLSTRAQESPFDVAPTTEPQPAAGVAATAMPDQGRYDSINPGQMPMGYPPGAVLTPIQEEMYRSAQAIRHAVTALRNSKNDDAKSKSKQQLTKLIEQYFDKDIQLREEDLTKIEERVRKLREQLDLRRAKKQEIIDLQIQVAVNEAEGLGFFSQPANDASGLMGSGAVRISPPPTRAVPYYPPSSTTEGTEEEEDEDVPAVPYTAPLRTN